MTGNAPERGVTRRQWLAASLGLFAGGLWPVGGRAAGRSARVVIVGGGVGGATAAKYLKLFAPFLHVTIVEKNPVYIRHYGSSEVLNQHVRMEDLRIGYEALRSRYGVEFLFDTVTGFDPVARTIRTAGRRSLGYDRLVVAPGVQLVYGAYPGYSEAVADTAVPSGWIAGRQTELLARQLQSMRPGGTFVLVAPPNPYRCPPGPYERAALMAEWFGVHNPTAKIVIIDPKDAFVTDETMLLAWNRLYRFTLPDDYAKAMAGKVEVARHGEPGILSWVRAKDGGRPRRIDARRMRVEIEGGVIQADVINVVPPMRAGAVAGALGLADGSGFCPVNRRDFSSTLQPGVFVVGDASIADAMPKSGFSANTQAKVVARAIVEELSGRPAPTPVWENTCFVLAGKDYGLFVADVFRIVDGKIARVNGPSRFLPLDASPAQIRLSARYQQAWLRTFKQDCFA